MVLWLESDTDRDSFSVLHHKVEIRDLDRLACAEVLGGSGAVLCLSI